MPKRKESFWDENNIADLVDLVDKGRHSTSQIAKILGTSSGSVSSMMFRMNLQNNYALDGNKHSIGKRLLQTAERFNKYGLEEIKTFPTCQYPVEELRNKDGIFVKDPFCGNKTVGTLPYCDHHAGVCYEDYKSETEVTSSAD